MTSGGFRPKGKFDANVSSVGGNGSKTGQPTRVAAGGSWGSRAESEAIQGASPMKVGAQASQQALPQITPPTVNHLLSEDGASGDPLTHGSDFGSGAGSDVLPKNFRQDPRKTENQQIIVQYLPDLVEALKAKNVPDSYKRFVNSLIQDTQ